MMFRKNTRLVGLDIGSSLIKVAALKHSSKGYELRRFGMTQLEPGIIVNGRIIDKQSLADTIRLLFKTLKIHEKNVAISAGGHSMLIRTINIPNISPDISSNTANDKELEEIIYSEAKQYLTYDMDELNIDYQILGENELEPSRLNVLLVAAQKDIVAEYADLIRLSGLRLQIIDVDIFALQNAYNILLNHNTESFTLIADVGASKMTLNIFKGDHSYMIRDIMYGSNKIAQDISDELGISYEAAEQALIRQSNDIDHQNRNRDQNRDNDHEPDWSQDQDQDKIRDISLRVIRSWCREIVEMVNEFQSGTSEARVDNIILSGGGLLFDDFRNYLLSGLDADISIINPFKTLKYKEKQFSTSFLTKAAPWAAIAIGLALRRVNDKSES